MNSTPIFRFAQLSLSAGIPRATVRNGHTWSRRRTAKPELSNFAPGHGEQIWSNHALKQLPFIAKKSTPAKLRKDLWRPMALIQFPAGAGTAGQSAFQKLREYRRRHELEWGDEKLYRTKEDAATGRLVRSTRTRKERGFAIHEQRENAIADMAAVLAGGGRGSKTVGERRRADARRGPAANSGASAGRRTRRRRAARTGSCSRRRSSGGTSRTRTLRARGAPTSSTSCLRTPRRYRAPRRLRLSRSSTRRRLSRKRREKEGAEQMGAHESK
ncbi:conserved hypothetical protein [Verticillium alfalfae VaMs.102]|uniref:Large ribosomal subunit protein mL67 n=1 Tax=Verticillium alfalfae (strain VaMs.102 / ATCC MYA-4576 / FGSC 10136) TaxID=526221 RepID=C9SPD6_VERA1|nr:conserved hypothetical protein [Verticillium alfalfae VaMs.102]EEY20651.1 conserved hypothetical protein [Verticillium alfalfae VaMs.102]